MMLKRELKDVLRVANEKSFKMMRRVELPIAFILVRTLADEIESEFVRDRMAFSR